MAPVHGRPSGGSRLRGVARAGVVGVLLCALSASAVRAAVAADGTVPYDYVPGAGTVAGTEGTAGASLLEAGSAYRSSLPRDGARYYRLELDAAETAYVSVTAVPRAGGTVAATDGVRVSLRDANGGTCSLATEQFGASHSPHPVAASASREVAPGSGVCQGAGTYYVVVERADAKNSQAGDWGLELTAVSEPGLKAAGATKAPEAWDSATPEPPAGTAVRRAGGAGFGSAVTVGRGTWTADIRPGRTLFYRVPLDWGQQLDATAELGAGPGSGYVTGALTTSLYNPVRDDVQDVALSYGGRAASAALDSSPPVAYANRFSFSDQVRAMRVAGAYYLVVHLAGQTADRFGDGPFTLTLRLGIRGEVRAGPGYAGRSVPSGVFEVSDAERDAATAHGAAGTGADPGMRAVAAGGIGGGTVLLAGLGVWTVLSRRRAAAAGRG
ncbi:hypothetical protein ACIQU5_20260 [Streptomyces sp. NPDC090306]|uniref:hypothetical protein n=1 Tax=Streptomyces sp. NPDC090306 TaxID=3365961 RepID=UPI0037FC1E3E